MFTSDPISGLAKLIRAQEKQREEEMKRGLAIQPRPPTLTLTEIIEQMMLKRAKPAEKVRAPLDWNKSPPVDRFADFEVTRGFTDQPTHSGAHPLQRLARTDDPLHGSAFLRG